MKRTTVLVKQIRPDKEVSLNRTVRIWVNGVEVDGIVSYMLDDTVGTPAQRVTLEFYADVTVENAEGAGR
jgi:hypothetical protein